MDVQNWDSYTLIMLKRLEFPQDIGVRQSTLRDQQHHAAKEHVKLIRANGRFKPELNQQLSSTLYNLSINVTGTLPARKTIQ
jgi:hypothetical protein